MFRKARQIWCRLRHGRHEYGNWMDPDDRTSYYHRVCSRCSKRKSLGFLGF